MIALGVERTIQQDPAFAIRIMVDIANRALSSAVNDPTTAVQVLNHLGETLRLGRLDAFALPSAPRAAGSAEVLVPVRRWRLSLAGRDGNPSTAEHRSRSCAACGPS